MPYFLSLLAMIAAYILGGFHGLFVIILLGILEISLSFDNAVVNASVLKTMPEKWQKRFLTWGILIAVFGMRLIFPIAIVSIASDNGLIEVVKMAIDRPDIYQHNLEKSHIEIAWFGGVFLALVFLNFLFDQEKELHWVWFEKYLSKFSLPPITLIPAAIMLIFVGTGALVGLLTYIIIKYFAETFCNTKSIAKAGFSSFIYLEILDASFSLDGVIGAFALSNDIFIIMLGLGVGAMFIRSMTIKLVKNKTLDEYIYLEHGAHYGIGALAIIMMLSTKFDISEIITGLIGVTFIGLSLISSIKSNKKS